MYPNYIEDRKSLGYEVLKDTSCGIKLVQITDSTVLLIRNLSSNVNHKTKRVILVIALVWSLKVNQVQAAPLTDADGFTSTHICRTRQTYSREATGLSSRLEQNPNNQNIPRENRAIYDRRVGDGSILEDSQVRKKFKHAPDFGILGNPNRKNYELFKDRIVDHMKNPSTRIKEGTFKKNIEVLHYFNEETGLNVMIRQNDNTFLTGWKLNNQQLQNVKDRGAL